MREYNLDEIFNADVLVDICDVEVPSELSKIERQHEFIRQIKDPYHYKCGKFTITAKYAKDGPSLEDCLSRLLV